MRISDKGRYIMKKKLIIALMLVMALVVTACGAGSSSDSGTDSDASGDGTYVGEAMPEFATYDIMGNEVTNDVFKDAELTVVNVWGTFCGPCIEEMPDLQALSEKYAGKVQFIGIVGDVNGIEDTEHVEAAKEITEQASVKFTNLVLSADFNEFMSGIVGFPTTIFVDKDGNILGDPIVGSNIPATDEFIAGALN